MPRSYELTYLLAINLLERMHKDGLLSEKALHTAKELAWAKCRAKSVWESQ
jgi:hypothetical protein